MERGGGGRHCTVRDVFYPFLHRDIFCNLGSFSVAHFDRLETACKIELQMVYWMSGWSGIEVDLYTEHNVLLILTNGNH